MKKYLVILAASSLLVFASCNKEKNQAYTIEGNKIVLNVAGELPQDNNAKQTWSGERLRIFFNSGDQININGTDYALSCYPSNIAGTSTSVSNYARVTCDLADDYKLFYPTEGYTSITPNADGTDFIATVNMPTHVTLIPNTAMNRFSTMNYTPVWPLYTFLSDEVMHENNPALAGATTEDGSCFELKNAVAVIAPEVIYGQEWAELVFGGSYENPADCPTLYFTDVVISANHQLTGAATLNTEDAAAPYIVMDNTLAEGSMDKVYCHLDTPVEINGLATSHVMLGNVAVPVMPAGTSFQANLYFYVVNADGSNTYYKYQSRTSQNIMPFRRSYRDFFDFNFQTVQGAGTGVTITSQATPFTIE